MSISSYISPKAKKGIKSKIAGRGLIAIKPIKKGEIVAIKGGHIIDWKTYNKHIKMIGASSQQIADNFLLAPLKKNEVNKVMLFLNHSCNPNIGLCGEIVFVAMRDINVGEELTTDYAMMFNYDKLYGELKLNCDCGARNCRKIITGKDWKLKNLQRKYGKYFSSFLQEKIRK